MIQNPTIDIVLIAREMRLNHQNQVFEALCPEIDFSDETIQKIQVPFNSERTAVKPVHFQGILETNMKEIRLAASDAVGVYAMAAMMEHSCMPNIKMTFDKQFNVSSVIFHLQANMKCAILDHVEGGAKHLRGRTPLHYVHPRPLGYHCKVQPLNTKCYNE